VSPRTGRRAGDTGTRDAILSAARRAFGEQGFTGATIRSIAAEARVDPALVMHYYGNKADLFAAAVDLPLNVRDGLAKLTSTEPEAIGEAMLRTVAGVWEDPDGLAAWLGLLRSAVADERAAEMLRDFLASAILAPVAERLGSDSDDAVWRVSLAAGQIVGLGIARYVVRIEPLASAPMDDIVAAVAPTLQRYLTGDLSPPDRPG
jgi:AcrR family transcriptional regulator